MTVTLVPPSSAHRRDRSRTVALEYTGGGKRGSAAASQPAGAPRTWSRSIAWSLPWSVWASPSARRVVRRDLPDDQWRCSIRCSMRRTGRPETVASHETEPVGTWTGAADNRCCQLRGRDQGCHGSAHLGRNPQHQPSSSPLVSHPLCRRRLPAEDGTKPVVEPLDIVEPLEGSACRCSRHSCSGSPHSCRPPARASS